VTPKVILRKIRSAGIRIRRYLVSQKFGVSPETLYGSEFYDGPGFKKTRDAADRIARFVNTALAPADVLDIGSGPGEYLRAFSELGISAIGCDGASAGVRRAVPATFAFVHDLRKPLVTNRKFGLVMCIEVAEHLPRSNAATLVASICGSSRDWVLFSAAPPEVDGDDHINCQPIGYWSAIFATHGFQIDEKLTAQLRQHAHEHDLPVWWKGWSYFYRRVGAAADPPASAAATRTR
jgi:SAM-dependent methyltransferase